MHILIKDRQRRTLFDVDVDPQHPPTVVRHPRPDCANHVPREVCLNWDQALDDQAQLRRCPVCGCRDLYVRKDFHQVTGLAIVLLAAVVAMVLFGMRQVFTAALVLALVVLLDAAIFFFTRRCLVCYRCRSEFRQTPIGRQHRPWDLAIGEKYRLPPGDTTHAPDSDAAEDRP